MQGLLNTVINLVDNLMIGSLGATAIASVGLANKVFLFFLLVFGGQWFLCILAAQYWGNPRCEKNIRKVSGESACLIALSGAILFLIPARWNPRLR